MAHFWGQHPVKIIQNLKMSKIENHQKHLCFTMFFEGRGMQKQPTIYKIPHLKPSKKHSQFQARFLLDFEHIVGLI